MIQILTSGDVAITRVFIDKVKGWPNVAYNWTVGVDATLSAFLVKEQGSIIIFMTRIFHLDIFNKHGSSTESGFRIVI